MGVNGKFEAEEYKGSLQMRVLTKENIRKERNAFFFFAKSVLVNEN